MENFDLVIIGGGIVGSCLFSQAVLSGVKTCLLEKEKDVSSYATKANSGIVHSGYDPIPNSKMAKFNVEGNKMFKEMCIRLGEKMIECGTLTVGRLEDREKLEELKKRGEQNGVLGLKIIEEKELKKMEPNLQEDIKLALFAPTGAVVSPFSICIGLVEEGMINGGRVLTDFDVCDIEKQSDGYVIKSKNNQVFGKFVVNCAGPNASEINKLFATHTFDLKFVKGEYILLDKSSKGFVNHPIFPLPNEKGKGILANISVYGNVMFGPTAVETNKEDTKVEMKGIEKIQKSIQKTVKAANFKKTIKLFAGVRVKAGADFVIERDDKNKNYYYAVGICSPGLTAAPAIAKHFLELMKQDGLETKKIQAKKRKPYVCVRELSKQELKKLVKQNPAYSKIVCRCEEVTEGEIIDALNSPLKPTSIAAIKRRVSPTMGRCQGSFCIPKIIRIMADELKKQRKNDKDKK